MKRLTDLSGSQRRDIANRLIQKLLIGEKVDIIDYFKTENPISLRGIVVKETRNTFVILVENREKIFPKHRIKIRIYDEKSKTNYLLDGSVFQGRPEERIKSTFRKMW